MSFIVKPNGSKFLLGSLLVIVLDQVTKYLIMANYPVNSVAFHVTSFFSIVHVHNQGAAFSFLASQPGWQRYFFIAVAALISIVLFIAILRTHKQKIWTNLAIALVLGGALGNLIDRLVLSYVVDFLLFYIKTDSFQYYYPAFNVADIAVCTGAFLLVVIGLFGKEQKGSK